MSQLEEGKGTRGGEGQSGTDELEGPSDFSLVLGGPLYQMWLRTRLVKPPFDLIYRRIIFISLLAWLPLLILSGFAGHLFGGVSVPFLFDADTHARFLGALPLLIAAEPIVHARIRTTAKQFLTRGLIRPEDLSRFDDAIKSSMRWRNSLFVELFLVALAFTVGHWIWRDRVRLGVQTWYAAPGTGEMKLTLAGGWYAFVSLPFIRFIAFRWYFRLFIWYRFLWKVSRFRLDLNPLHPDRTGGLGFLGGSMYALMPILISHTVLASGVMANRIWHEGAKLPEFKLLIAGIVGYLILIGIAPLVFFCGNLAREKRSGLREFGEFASSYVAAFKHKWLAASDPKQETLLGSADIQSLADLSTSFDVVREMRSIPCGKQDIGRVAILLVVPFLPLTLTMFRFEEVFDKLLGILF